MKKIITLALLLSFFGSAASAKYIRDAEAEEIIINGKILKIEANAKMNKYIKNFIYLVIYNERLYQCYSDKSDYVPDGELSIICFDNDPDTD